MSRRSYILLFFANIYFILLFLQRSAILEFAIIGILIEFGIIQTIELDKDGTQKEVRAKMRLNKQWVVRHQG